jgi:hypothetical protein
MTDTVHLDAEMLDMLRASLRHVLGETSDQPLSTRLAELGWDEVTAGDGPTARRVLFEIKGETISAADALTPELARTLADATGDVSLAEAAIGLPSPYGVSIPSGDAVTVDAVVLGPLDGRPLVIEIGDRLARCAAGDLADAPLGGLDERFGARRVTGTTQQVTWLDGAAWSAVVAEARRLLASELVGLAGHVVATAVDYTKERVQYGKPIGVFQALQHRMAAAHALVVGAGHLSAEAAVAGDEWSAMVAKCMAGMAAEHACTQAQQCYGAIGFTWEHEFPHYLRRMYTLDRLFGDWRSLEVEIGERLQRDSTVPRIGSL